MVILVDFQYSPVRYGSGIVLSCIKKRGLARQSPPGRNEAGSGAGVGSVLLDPQVRGSVFCSALEKNNDVQCEKTQINAK